MANLCVLVSCPSARSAIAPSPRSRASAPRPQERGYRRLGWTWKSSRAAIASPVRSCRQRPCSLPRHILTIPTLMLRWQETSVAAAPMSASVKRSSAPPVTDRHRRPPMSSLEHLARSPSRRAVLQGSLAGWFVLGFHLPARAVNEPEPPPDSTEGKFAPNAFIRIDRSGQTTLVMPQVEMGQGVYTAVAMILAEELDADFSKVTLEHAPPNDQLYSNPTFGIQVTGNSNSIRSFWKPLRVAGAAARLMLVQAAAQQWQVDPASCSTSNSVVRHESSNRMLAYGDLVDAASAQPVPRDPPLKDPKDFTLIGKPLKRFDTPNKAD